jgi:hypothetical protein
MSPMEMPAPFTPFEPRWDRPQLASAELALASAFEWWYFDLSSDDGTSLVVVFNRRNPVLSSGGASIYIEYLKGSDHFRRACNYPLPAFAVVDIPGGFEIRIDRHRLRVAGEAAESLTYQLEVDLPDFAVSLEMHPEHRGFLPTSDGCYFTRRGDASERTCVSFSAPQMRASGSLTYRGQTNAVHGRGYHDHPWGTAQLFTTHDRWNWGRMWSPASAVMFASVTPRQDFEGTLHFMYVAELGAFEPRVSSSLAISGSAWKRDGLFGIRFPHQLEVTSDERVSSLMCTHSLLDTLVYNRSAVTWTGPGATSQGTGWLEYYDLPGWLRGIVFLGSRIVAFFWRPFPWFGR